MSPPSPRGFSAKRETPVAVHFNRTKASRRTDTGHGAPRALRLMKGDTGLHIDIRDTVTIGQAKTFAIKVIRHPTDPAAGLTVFTSVHPVSLSRALLAPE